MVIIGKVMFKRPPKKINSIYGYRTSRSMKNQDTWNFAHMTCGKIWWKFGWLIILPTVAVQLPFLNSDNDVIGTVGFILCMIQCLILLLSILPIERALKKTFNSDGSRK